MANHASAQKRNRQRIKRTIRNRSVKSTVRSIVKRARVAAAVTGGATATIAATETALTAAFSALDKAAKCGIIHPNKSARTASRLSKRAHASKSAPAAAPAKK